jgi:hypothetical protein
METNIELYKYSSNGIKKRNPDLWDKINSIDLDLPFKAKFFLYENNMDEPKCYCGNKVKFVDMKKGFREFCSRKCMLNSKEIKEKRKKTTLEKYGVKNVSQLSETKEKVKKTNNKKFGADYPLQSKDILEKNKEFFISKYGVDNPSKVKSIREKAENTNLEKYGFKQASKSDQVKENVKKYFIEKYGVDNPSKLEEVKDKIRKTNLEKYGDVSPIRTDKIKNKIKNNFIEKYGVDNPSKLEEVKNKVRKTNLEKYGDEIYFRTVDYKEKSSKTNLEKYNVLNYSQTNEFKEKIKKKRKENIQESVNDIILNVSGSYIELICNECGDGYKVEQQLLRKRTRNDEICCTNCNPVFKPHSVGEKELLNYIKSIYDGEIIENYKDDLEIDIFLPKLNIGFEYNGLYWHSELHKDKNYHYNKKDFFDKKEIHIIFIWEDFWLYKKDIVKSFIKNKIGKSKRIYARKCKIIELKDNSLIHNFLEENHIQGFVGSKIKLGLEYEGELVSIMTFGSLRRALGSKSSDKSYELLRFCNRKGLSVIGGASKLFNHFKRNFEYSEIISYSLNDYSNGNLYNKIGFEYTKETKYNYFWVKDKKRHHRFSFRKDKLVSDGFDENKSAVDIMYERDYFRIFDSGSKKWTHFKY